MMPLGMRMRIMKWPGVCLRKKVPHHFSRSRSPSSIASYPSSAKRGMSAPTSRPSRSFLISSILFTHPPCSGPARNKKGRRLPALGIGTLASIDSPPSDRQGRDVAIVVPETEGVHQLENKADEPQFVSGGPGAADEVT